MIPFLLRRLAASLLLVWLVVSLSFVLVHAAPGDPADSLVGLERTHRAEQRQKVAEIYGLDRPLGEQYLTWLGNYARGDLGTSWSLHRPVVRVLADALPATLLLAFAAVGLEMLIAIPLGIWAARRPDSFVDHLLRGTSLLLFSLPTFWLGLMALLVFSLYLGVLPPGYTSSADAHLLGPWGRALDYAWHLVLPATVLAIGSAGMSLRFVRNKLLDVLGEDYVRTARAKGLGEARVVGVHALRNAVGPLVQMVGVNLGALLNGALVVEMVFSWPGLGRRSLEALQANDLPLLLATTALAATMVILGNLLADLGQALVDPRVRLG